MKKNRDLNQYLGLPLKTVDITARRKVVPDGMTGGLREGADGATSCRLQRHLLLSY